MPSPQIDMALKTTRRDNVHRMFGLEINCPRQVRSGSRYVYGVRSAFPQPRISGAVLNGRREAAGGGGLVSV